MFRLVIISALILILVSFQYNCKYGLKRYKDNFENTVLLNNDSLKNEKLKAIDVLKSKTDNLIDLLKKSNYKDKIAVKRLINKWNGNINEIEATFKKNQILGYNINKGESIHVCLVNPKDNTIISDYNTMFFVILHELAHIMTKTYNHDEEFWNNFSFLIEFCHDNGLYDYIDYHENPINFCGGVINSTPYKMETK